LTPRSRRAPLATALVTVFALLVPLGASARADHVPTGPYLNLDPEMPRTATRDRVKMRALLMNAAGNAVAANVETVVNFEIEGPGDPEGGTSSPSFDTPDRTCKIAIDKTHCRLSYANVDGAGFDNVWAWIAGTTPDEAEARSIDPAKGGNPGTHADPDTTDVATPEWFLGLAPNASLDCDPERSTVAAGRSKTFTCTVSNNGPVGGWEIDGENLTPGVNNPDAPGSRTADYNTACVTGSNGRCTVTIPAQSASQAGRAVICFWVDEEQDASFHPAGRWEWDASQCDSEAARAAEGGNHTDLVSLTWKHRRSVTIGSSRDAVARGQSFRLGGRITSTSAACAASQRVTVHRDVLNDGRVAFSVLRRTTSTSNGRYTVTVRARRAARYKVSVTATAKCLAAASNAKRVGIRG
jgi:hypothetical protein